MSRGVPNYGNAYHHIYASGGIALELRERLHIMPTLGYEIRGGGLISKGSEMIMRCDLRRG